MGRGVRRGHAGWSATTVFQYDIVRGVYSDPCDDTDFRNGVKFDDTHCGDAWGSTTLAACTIWYQNDTIVETNIVFNAGEPWNVYWGPWRYDVNDFRRVAVHELGHAIGLAHEDSGVPTIMGTYAGDITVPQPDDIDGVTALYGPSCSFSISPDHGEFAATGGSRTVFVSASHPDCEWTASESLSWVSLSDTGGTGSGNVTLTVAPNTDGARTGSVRIAGRTLSLLQRAGGFVKSTVYLSSIHFSHTVPSGHDDRIYGTRLPNLIILEQGGRAELINFPGRNQIEIRGNSDDFLVSRSGTLVTFQAEDGTRLKIPATLDVQRIFFNDRQLNLTIDADRVKLGIQMIQQVPVSIFFTGMSPD